MFDLDASLHELSDLDEDLRLGPSTGSIVNAAVARGVPFRRLTQGSLVQFGWGHKQRHHKYPTPLYKASYLFMGYGCH